jgi:sarcosine oxidase subunit delta
MRINCPCCGERGVDEFVYHGDASVQRPESLGPGAMAEFVRYVYERTNTPGIHRELWFHAAGCHSWLVVTRGIATHKITTVELAREVARNRNAIAAEIA